MFIHTCLYIHVYTYMFIQNLKTFRKNLKPSQKISTPPDKFQKTPPEKFFKSLVTHNLTVYSI